MPSTPKSCGAMVRLAAIAAGPAWPGVKPSAWLASRVTAREARKAG